MTTYPLTPEQQAQLAARPPKRLIADLGPAERAEVGALYARAEADAAATPVTLGSRIFDRLCDLTTDPTDRRDPLPLHLFNRVSGRWCGARWFEWLRGYLMPDTQAPA